jgi:two-component system response regulator FlrC
VLRSGGYQTVEAADGGAALAVLREGPVSLVLTDIQMAPMDGHTLLREIKRLWPQTPVVMMTAYGDVARAVQAVRRGASHYLVKPFEVDVLLGEVARFKRTLAEGRCAGGG